LPDWLFERLQYLPNLEQLAHALNQPAALDIRVNPMKAERDEMLADLTRGNAVRHAPVATPYSPWGIRLTGRPTMNKWHQFEHGLIEVQDEGSQLLALLVGPKRGEMVIDFCAGAGGKTLLLGALMRSTGRLYALDVSATRLAKAKPRFARSGLSNIVPVVLEHENDTRVRRLAGKAQRVLVDAPCSGVGTLRRNPDLKWRQSVQSLQELTALQARILASASRCVAPGGRLVYATCSLLVEENQAQAERFGTEVLLDDVIEVELTGETKIVKTGGGETFEAKTVILSTGAAYRELGLPREKELSGHGVSWCATCDGFFFRERTIAVVGGGDSAMEEATFLTRFAAKVYLIHRRDSFKASKIMVERALNNPKIEVIYNSEVTELLGDPKLIGVTLRDTVNGATSNLDLDGLFIAIGNDPRVWLVEEQVELTSEKFIKVDGRSSRTNIPGVFAAGDVIDPTYRQAITAAGSGCVAALDAEHYLQSH
jgi:thioredoxin-disulfide reductase